MNLIRETYPEFLKSAGHTQVYDAIFIGSGISALTAATLLAKSGKRVLILEQHYAVGGFTHTFMRKGFEWDVGIHYVGEAHVDGTFPARAFDYLTEGAVHWESLGAVYDQAIFPDAQYPFVSGLSATKERLYAWFPDEHAAIDQYWKLVKRLNDRTLLYFIDKTLPRWLSRWVGGLLRRSFLSLSNRTTLEVLKSITSNPRLIAVLTAQWGDYGLPPGESSFAIHAILAQHFLRGAAYPAGGASTIAQGIVGVLSKHGGRVVVRARVARILKAPNDDGVATGVVMEDGTEIRAQTVISATGVRNSARLEPQVATPEQLAQLEPSMSHLCLYVGLNKTAQELKLPKENWWIFPSDDHDGNWRRFLEDPEAEFPFLFFSFPAAKDPQWETHHPGTASIDLITPAAFGWFEDWDGTKAKTRGQDYEAFKDRFRKRLEAALLKHLPQIQGAIVTMEFSTPLSTSSFSEYKSGEIYGVAHTPERFQQNWLTPYTPVKNLYLTGQDVFTGGIVGALNAGALTASVILKRNCFAELARPRTL